MIHLLVWRKLPVSIEGRTLKFKVYVRVTGQSELEDGG